MYRYLLLLFILAFFNLSAKETVAIVSKIRGEATYLLPGAHDAKKLKEGDKLLSDTSILTSDKSFVQIKFIDDTILNLGPLSKVVINEIEVGAPGIISLLKGRIRTEVTKSKSKNENKFFIKTRSAALGVRGTEFQTIYNPDNHLTSLLTFKGEVKMTKIDETEYNKIESLQNEIQVNPDDSTKIDIIKSADSGEKIAKKLNQILSNDRAVTVLAGQNSIALEGQVKVTPPVDIDATQVNILYKNKEFSSKNAVNFKPAKNLSDEALVIRPIKNDTEIQDGVFRFPSGGFVDSNTGFYIAPTANSQVDRDTGEFIIPKGIKLDSKRGFVVEGETDDPVMYALRDDLNKSIASDISIRDAHREKEVDLNELYVHDEFVLSIAPMSSLLNINDSQYKIKSGKSNFKSSLEWRLSAKNRIRPIVGVGVDNLDLNDGLPNDITMGARRLYSMYTGLMYAYSTGLELYSSIGFFEEHYLNYSSANGTKTLKKVATTKAKLGVLNTFLKNHRFPLHTDFMLNYQFAKNINTLDISNAVGFSFFLGTSYEFESKNLVKFGLWWDSSSVDVISDTLNYKHNRKNSGLILNYIIR